MPIKIKSTGGGSVSIDVPNTGSDFTLTAPANNATLFTTAGGTISGNVTLTSNVAFTSNNVTIGGQALSSATGMRNRIINGGFDVWQRGTSFTANTPIFTADRWLITHTGTALTASYTRQDANGVWGSAKYYIRLARTAGSGMTQHSFTQRIEGVETLQNGKATFSFDCRDITGERTIGVRLVQNFGSGGSADVTITSQTVSIPSGSTPQRRSVTFDIPSIVGKTIGTSDYLALIIDLPLDGNFQIDLTNAQLEIGSVATSFERRTFGLELALCQRYYEVGELTFYFTPWSSSSLVYFPVVFTVQKRATPTVTRTGVGGVTGSTSGTIVSATAVSTTSFYWEKTGTVAIGGAWTAAIEL